MTKQINMYNGRVFVEKVSDYGLKEGYLDYRTLSKIVGDCILNNQIRSCGQNNDWVLISGEEEYLENGEWYYYDVYQEYIITEAGYKFLKNIQMKSCITMRYLTCIYGVLHILVRAGIMFQRTYNSSKSPNKGSFFLFG